MGVLDAGGPGGLPSHPGGLGARAPNWLANWLAEEALVVAGRDPAEPDRRADLPDELDHARSLARAALQTATIG